MSSVVATRAARRRGLAFLVLLLISVILMAFSSNPTVRDVQSGIGFAFRPIEGALDGVAAAVASVAGGLAEIDRLRVDNATLKADNDRLAAENARLDEIRRQNEQLTALLQFRAAMDFKTTAATVIARESSEFRRLIVLDRGTNDGIAVGDVAVAAGGALVGRVTEAGPDSSKVVLLTDTGSTVIGQLTTNAATGDVIGQLGGVLIMKQIDASKPVATGDQVVTAGSSSATASGRRIRRACSSARSSIPDATRTTSSRPPSWSRRRRWTRSSSCLSSPITTEASPRPMGRVAGAGSQRALLPRAYACRRAPGRVRVGARRRARTGRRAVAPEPARGRLLPFSAMKEIVLAGGTATRLYPLTIVTNKHLLPIYDRPMIYYPIETLAGMGIREVMVVVGGKSVGDVVELLADGSAFGLDLTYRYQPGALGIAHAIGLARDFVGSDAFCCVLGDNILRGAPLADVANEFEDGEYGAGTLLYRVPDPERFGVAELDPDGNVIGFEEKPQHPKSDLIPIGVYFLRPDAFQVIDGLLPSGRGELEITDVLNHYIPLGPLFSRVYEGHWTDAGTVPSLLRAAEIAAEDHAAGRLQPPVTRPVA